jgi:cobalt-zinc-cadmium resistance protein CzcA
MIERLIEFSIKNKLIIGVLIFTLTGWGVYSLNQIPIDAVPDITNNQVQVITKAPTLAAQEVEQFITFPIEISMRNLPDVVEIRSISRFGLSVVTVVFKEDMDIYLARQLISEQLKTAEEDIPQGFGSPELAPITTGLGEVYQYVLRTAPGYDTVYSDMDLRTMNDWIVKRQLAGTPGVIEIGGWGGHLKQYEVSINPEKLKANSITLAEVFSAVESNNENTGGSYIEQKHNMYFIRGDGLVKTLKDIENIVIKTINGVPVLIRDVAEVKFGSAPRYGAITRNDKGEVVGGLILMLKGENSYEVVKSIKERIETIRKSLPEGVIIESYLDRSELIGRAIRTVSKNLIEGACIVIFILIILLGNFRGGLIVASVIPLSMLFAVGMMNVFGVSANLMSLGAIDFGLIVDGAVIIVESIVLRLHTNFAGQKLTRKQMNNEVRVASSGIRKSAAFGEIIILIVYLPILALVGIEGKMFKPMAQTVSFAILGALILSLTYVPMVSSLFLKKKIRVKRTLADKIIDFFQRLYSPMINFVLRHKVPTVAVAILLLISSVVTFNKMGGEFIPTLEEGDFALHQILPPGTSLAQSVDISHKIQDVLTDNFPEVETVVTKIGTGEVPTDPMPVEVGDIMVKMKPKSEWTSAETKEEMFEKMKEKLSIIPGVNYEFTQPIQMRFNELMSGVREDVAVKIYGENMDVLYRKAKEAEKIISSIQGVGDISVEPIQGVPQLVVTYNRSKIAQYGLNISDLNSVLKTAFAGEKAGVVFEEEKRFDLVVRLDESFRKDKNNIDELYVPLPSGEQVPLKELASIDLKSIPVQISRDNTKRRVVVGVNARNRDIETLVEEISSSLDEKLNLPAGYHINYAGQFENLVTAKRRLLIAVPSALALIFILLFFTFKSVKQALLIFTAIPFAAIGGVFLLSWRGMPFSISAGIGFIALFGVAVLNGIVLIAYFNHLKKEGITDVRERIIEGTRVRLRPVIITASVAALGFLPMALSGSAGAEVQRPLATVVIGGLISATLLTLLVLPILYYWFNEGIKIKSNKMKINKTYILIPLLIGLFSCSSGQGEEGHEHHEEEEGHKSEEVHLLQQQIDVMGIESGSIQKMNLSTTIKSNGTLELPPQNRASVSTVLGGRVSSIKVIEGDKVSKGQVLALIEHPDYIEIQEEYLTTFNSLKYIEVNYERQKKLHSEGVNADKTFQEIEADYLGTKSRLNSVKAQLQMIGLNISEIETGKIQQFVPIKSPISGYVRLIKVNTGKSVLPQTELFEIVDIDHIHIDLMVYEQDINKVKEGQKVIFTLPSNPDSIYVGRIFAVGKSFEQNPKALRIHAEIDNKNGNLLPGMFVDARIITKKHEVLAVPNDAIVSDEGLSYIFVKIEKSEEHHDENGHDSHDNGHDDHDEGEDHHDHGEDHHDNDKEEDHHDHGEDEHSHGEGDELIFKKVEVSIGTTDIGFTEIVPVDKLSENPVIIVKGAYYLLAEMKKGEGGHGHHH